MRQRSAVFHVLGFAILIFFLSCQTVAKLTRRRTRFDTANSHILFFLTAGFMVLGGGAQVVAPQPKTSWLVSALGGFICLAGLVMIAAEARDFEPWLEERRVAREERDGR